ncbi:MAG TPA: hypothetical protein VGN97_16355 [Mesorhizobium sp.]|jgi:hypothetical protein|nr:hypothetical protein [Mesorhizobium sp.]
MARAPNYDHERKERDRLKAARKAEKLAAKAEKRSKEPASAEEPETSSTEA